MPEQITVIKQDHDGCEAWRYQGRILERGIDYVILEALFNMDDRDDGYFVWQRGDRFVEYHYSDRWYNIFEIHDGNGDHIRGWYCNLTRPAHITDSTITSDDLELDFFVYPDGRQLVKDEEKFKALRLGEQERQIVLELLGELQTAALEGRSPFFRD